MPISIIKKFSNSTGNTPTLTQGEIGVNVTDKKLFIGPSGGGATLHVASLGNQDASNISITGGAINGTSISVASHTTNSLQLGSGATVTSVSTDGTMASNSNSVLPTQGAVQTYANSAKGALKNIYSWTSAGTFTYTKSGSDVQVLRVIVVGAGGGGRGYGESGGAGGYTEGLINATGISTVAVTIGGGGGGGVYFGFSGQGATSSFGAYLSASGGYGSSNNQQHSGGHGGYGFGGSTTQHGGGGSGHKNCHSVAYHNPGHGGQSFFGGANAGDHYTQTFAPGVMAPGAGGGGHNHYNYSGYNGKDGAVVVYEYR
jgi:hypothetical protein